MFNFFGKKEAESPAKAGGETAQEKQGETQYKNAPGTEIHYHPDLIENLKSDHKRLLGRYGDIKSHFEAADYEQVAGQLEQFKMDLQGHLLTENIKLYIYLDHMLANDEMNATLIKEFRREMDGIARVALKFLSKYEAIGVDKDLAPSFAKDFAEIGKVLVERIKREEEVLYPLYVSSY